MNQALNPPRVVPILEYVPALSFDRAGAVTSYDQNGTITGISRVLNGEYWVDVCGVGVFKFGADSSSVMVAPDRSAPRSLVVDTYNRILLPAVLHGLEWEVLHASAVVSPSGVVAFCADSQTGKSTIAYGLSKRGYPLYADDALPFSLDGSTVGTLALPFYIRLRPGPASLFGLEGLDLQSSARHAATEITAYHEMVPLSALFVLEQENTLDNGATFEIDCLSSGQVVKALLDHAYYLDLTAPDRWRRMAHRYIGLAGTIPILRLRFQPGLEHLHTVLDGLEETIDNL